MLADEPARWKLVRNELKEVKKAYGDGRRSEIAGPDQGFSYTEEDYIIEENVSVIVTRDGWVKRQKSYTDLANIRVRDGDEGGLGVIWFNAVLPLGFLPTSVKRIRSGSISLPVPRVTASRFRSCSIFRIENASLGWPLSMTA